MTYIDFFGIIITCPSNLQHSKVETLLVECAPGRTILLFIILCNIISSVGRRIKFVVIATQSGRDNPTHRTVATDCFVLLSSPSAITIDSRFSG